MAWKKGPLPKDTWGWGAVVTDDKVSVDQVQGDEDYTSGFEFASFCGDHAKSGGREDGDRIEAERIAFYDNSIQLPIKTKNL